MYRSYIFEIFVLACLVITVAPLTTFPFRTSGAKCHYGERGSLTAQCVNITSSTFFKLTPYRFDHLDETLNCINCSLGVIGSGSFDLNNNNLMTLNLKDSKITALSNSSFVGLVQLKTLILNNNQIETLQAGVFTGIKKVTFLDLSANALRTLQANCFAELGNLTELILTHNVIANISSGAFNGLGALEKLNLENNDLKSLEGVFDGLPKLKFLNLRDNLISDLQPTQINMSSLVDLDLSQNKLNGVVRFSFTAAQNLENLNLSSNQITFIEDGAFKGLSNLEYLDLNSNNLTNTYITGLAFLRLFKLRDLRLAYNQLTIFDIKVFTSLPELRYLNTSHNSIVGIFPGSVLKMYNLHSLDLSFNKINYLDYKSMLVHAPKLVEMRLDNNNLPCYLIEEILNYFGNDNILLTGEDSDVNFNKTCNKTVTKDNFDMNLELKEIEKMTLLSAPHTSGHFYTIYAFIIILMVVICILGYSQYKMFTIYRRNNYADGTHTNLITNTSFENRMTEHNDF